MSISVNITDMVTMSFAGECGHEGGGGGGGAASAAPLQRQL